MSYFLNMDAHKQGRDAILVCNKDIDATLGKVCEHDFDNDVVHLLRSANIVRRDMFKITHNFNGSFDYHCQANSVPVSLLALVSMVLYGSHITSSHPSPALRNQPSPSHSYSCTTVWCARGKLPS